MAPSNISISKGGITVAIHTAEVNDNYDNKLFVIKPAQSKNNQANGTKSSKIVDLLRITHSMIIRGYITGTASKTAIAVKQDLVNIWKGAGIAGGVVSLTYDTNASAFGDISATATNPISGFIEKVNFKDISMDEPDDFVSSKEDYQDIAKFEITLTFIEGVSI